MKNYMFDFIKGIVIGVANIIPGVSGGTMALVLGIYERLISGLNSISLSTIKSFIMIFSFRKNSFEKFKSDFSAIEGPLLTRLFIGAAAAIFSLASIMSYLLEKQHDPTYGFFFGLVMVSAITPYQLIKKKSVSVFVLIVLSAAGVIFMSESMSGDNLILKAKARQTLEMTVDGSKTAISDSDPAHLAFMFFAGAAAISAMILPGISGSFVLLMMGGYFEILKAISSLNFLILGVFSAGCIVGIILFTKILNYLLKKFYDPTMASLLGLVAGSLWVIWPFKNSVAVGNEVIYLSNKIPESFGLNEAFTIAAFTAGSLIVALMILIEKKQRHS